METDNPRPLDPRKSWVVCLDIETVPEDAHVGMDLNNPPQYALDATEPPPVEARACPKNYKKPEAIAAWHKKDDERYAVALKKREKDWLEAAKAKYAKQSLDPLRGRIMLIGLGIYAWEDGVLTRHSTYMVSGEGPTGADEKALLEKAWGILQAMPLGTIVAAHNGLAFDFPYIQLRAIKHGMMKMARFFSVGKPWESNFVDTMKEWPATGFGPKRSGRSLDVLMEFLGDERPKNPFTGAEVLPAYVAGDERKIRVHCIDDLRCVARLYQIISDIKA